MINNPALVAYAQAETPPEWTIEPAWTMAPIDIEEVKNKLPFAVIYQGKEAATPRTGSPCSQDISSKIQVIVIAKHAELDQRLQELRGVLYGWKKAGDVKNSALWISDRDELGVLEIKGDYIWWSDVWLTKYQQTHV